MGRATIAVWGSPHAGKTTFSLKLAQKLYERTRASVVVLFCDILTPSLPVLFPNRKSTAFYSVGTVLSKTDVFANDVAANLMTLKERSNLGFLGYRSGENRYSFPEYTAGKVEALLAALSEVADYVVADCPSDPTGSVLSDCLLKRADVLMRLSTPDLASIAFHQSQTPMQRAAGHFSPRVVQVMNTVEADLAALAEDAAAYLGKIDLTIPYSRELRAQYLEGQLAERTGDRRYMQAVEEAVRRVTADGAD